MSIHKNYTKFCTLLQILIFHQTLLCTQISSRLTKKVLKAAAELTELGSVDSL